MKFSDPTGHRECELNPDGSCMAARKLNLWNYAADTLNELGGKRDKNKNSNSLEALARIVDKASHLYGTFEKMIPALTEIFLGVNESNPLTAEHARGAGGKFPGCGGLGMTPKTCRFNTEDTASFWDTGFAETYQDGDQQVYHFWAYLSTAASTDTSSLPGSSWVGTSTAYGANYEHEVIEGVLYPSRDGTSWEDYALGYAGVYIGHQIASGAIRPTELGDTIRYMGTQGNSVVNTLNQYFPLP